MSREWPMTIEYAPGWPRGEVDCADLDDLNVGLSAAVNRSVEAFLSDREIRPAVVHDRANEAKEDYLNTLPPTLYRLMKDDIARVWSLLESPIEQIAVFYLASENYGKEDWPIYAKVVRERGAVSHRHYPVQIIPQVTFGRYRVDFLIDLGSKGLVAVECDGAEFHQDAAKDRRRDEEISREHGVTVFRLSGKQLWRDNECVKWVSEMVRFYLEWGRTPR